MTAAPDFFERWRSLPLSRDGDSYRIGEEPIMYEWEEPLMKAFASRLCSPEADLLEIGFGMGIFANIAQRLRVRNHTVVEPHPEVIAEARHYSTRTGAKIRIVEDYWQKVIGDLGTYDSIFYDSFSPEETLLADLDTFFGLAARSLLRAEGRLGFWVPGTTLSAEFQGVVFRHFDELSVTVVRGLRPGQQCQRQDLSSTMLVPIATLPRQREGSR